ncbi:MAG: DUF4186 domain-containing protein [Phycisphaerales bacterium]|nr:MAG: DUF4186 domain-containing protein [Phycisphaerales bacterium]
MDLVLDDVFAALNRSSFRRRFRLGERERAYLDAKGIDTILRHARDFIQQRLAPAQPRNDGKQTPMRGHPVFIAQHATATCCRTCLSKWHRIPKGRPLTSDQQDYVRSVIETWIERNTKARTSEGSR